MKEPQQKTKNVIMINKIKALNSKDDKNTLAKGVVEYMGYEYMPGNCIDNKNTQTALTLRNNLVISLVGNIINSLTAKVVEQENSIQQEKNSNLYNTDLIKLIVNNLRSHKDRNAINKSMNAAIEEFAGCNDIEAKEKWISQVADAVVSNIKKRLNVTKESQEPLYRKNYQPQYTNIEQPKGDDSVPLETENSCLFGPRPLKSARISPAL